MNPLLPIAVVYGLFHGNSNAASTHAKLDLLTAATLYPDEVRAALARKRDERRALWVFVCLLWFGIFLLVEFGLTVTPAALPP